MKPPSQDWHMVWKNLTNWPRQRDPHRKVQCYSWHFPYPRTSSQDSPREFEYLSLLSVVRYIGTSLKWMYWVTWHLALGIGVFCILIAEISLQVGFSFLMLRYGLKLGTEQSCGSWGIWSTNSSSISAGYIDYMYFMKRFSLKASRWANCQQMYGNYFEIMDN